MKIFSPAKINLFLHVRSKRKDGYHEIETLFERIRLCDTVTLGLRASGIRVHCSGYSAPSGPKNLAYRAAALLKKDFGITRGVEISIQKRIPVSAGLGGGSGNAAAVLLGLNRLWKLRLSKKTLLGLAARLGSDVPFFVLETPFAVGRGRGEILRKVRMPRGFKLWHCLVKPPFGISTKEAYAGLDRLAPSTRSAHHLTPQKTDVRMLLRSIQKGDSDRLAKCLVNSLEASVNSRVRTIQGIKEELLRYGSCGSLMSGSGSAVFGVFKSKKKAEEAARVLKRRRGGFQVFVVSTL